MTPELKSLLIELQRETKDDVYIAHTMRADAEEWRLSLPGVGLYPEFASLAALIAKADAIREAVKLKLQINSLGL